MAPPARQHRRFCAVREIHRQGQRMPKMVVDQFARDAAAHEIRPTEFTERRFVLRVSAGPFERPCQGTKGIVDEFVHRSRHAVVGAPPAMIVEWMSPVVYFEGFPEFFETEPTHIRDDRDTELPDPFVVQCEREMMAVD